jgi:hypothetical protein
VYQYELKGEKEKEEFLMTLSVAHLIIDAMFAILNLRQGKIRSNIMLFYLTPPLIDI